MADDTKSLDNQSITDLCCHHKHPHVLCDGFPTILFHAREMKELAEEIRSCSKQHRIELGDIEWKVFADSWPNIFIRNSEQIHNSHVLFLASLHNPQTIFEQISLLYHLPKYLCRSLKVLLPYFPTGTMERIQIQGEIATAYSLAQMLSAIPLTRTGPCEVVIFDIHALQNQFYFSSNIIVRLESTVELLLKELKSQNEKYAIVFPDDGAHKRFGHMFDEKDYPVLICSKIREGDQRITTIKEGDPKGYHCMIIDDLVQSGGTLIECAQAVLNKGATKVSAFVGHGIFPNESWKKFIYSENPKVHFDTFYVTNTYPKVQVLIDKPPFKVLSIAQLLCNICFT
jgi:ribose-phosphate pyrophosphokinase